MPELWPLGVGREAEELRRLRAGAEAYLQPEDLEKVRVSTLAFTEPDFAEALRNASSSPFRCLWLTTSMTHAELKGMVPDSWDEDPDEWRLGKI